MELRCRQQRAGADGGGWMEGGWSGVSKRKEGKWWWVEVSRLAGKMERRGQIERDRGKRKLEIGRGEVDDREGG
jgi:hypothetical protein